MCCATVYTLRITKIIIYLYRTDKKGHLYVRDIILLFVFYVCLFLSQNVKKKYVCPLETEARIHRVCVKYER